MPWRLIGETTAREWSGRLRAQATMQRGDWGPLGPGDYGGIIDKPPIAKEQASSNLERFARFLAEMGSHGVLMGRKNMLKSIKNAGLTEGEVALVKGGDAAKIAAHLDD